eukprot:757180-Hanusia_phi.AAC.1
MADILPKPTGMSSRCANMQSDAGRGWRRKVRGGRDDRAGEGRQQGAAGGIPLIAAPTRKEPPPQGQRRGWVPRFSKRSGRSKWLTNCIAKVAGRFRRRRSIP